MNLFEPIIRRPIGTSLLAIGLAIAGFCTYLLLGVAALPSMDLPGLVVIAQYQGADAQTIATTVAAPLERRLGRIPGIYLMTSDNTAGAARIQVLLNYGLNVDKAARDVQAAINAAQPDLPASMPPPQYYKFDTTSMPVLLISLTSTSMPPDKLYDLTDTLLTPTVAQIPGVAQVQVFGGAPHAVRVNFNPSALTARGLIANDIANALRAANVASPQGIISDGITQMTVTANDALHTPRDFARLVVANQKGVPVYLSDVATITSGEQDKYQAAWFNGQRAVSMQISKRPDANAVQVAQDIRSRLPALRNLVPADVQITPIFDLTRSTKSALHEVEVALLLSIVMVAVVMLVFLRRLRPTLIAMLSVPLSLAGAFVAMYALGFTLNIISLLALVLCIGFVVDDAIVVIENVVRHIERGMEPLESALVGVREIGFTVISITVSLIAVFVPMVIGNDTLVMLMREFSVTLMATIVISALVSLTLTPALCGRYLLPEPPAGGKRGQLEALAERFDRGILRIYERSLDWAMHHRRIMRWQPLVLLILTVLLVMAVSRTAGGAIMPKEDTGMLIAQMDAEPNISPSLMAQRTEAMAAMMQVDPAIADVTTLLGGNSNNGAVGNHSTLFVDLKPLGNGPGQRSDSLDNVVDRLSKTYKAVPDISLTMRGMQFLGGGGGNNSGGAFSFHLVSNNGAPLQPATLKLAQVMRTMKQFTNVHTSYDDIGKQQLIEVDRDAAARLNVEMGQIDQALADAFGQTPVSMIYSDVNQYRVVLTANNADTLTLDTLLNTYVRSSQNKMVPLSSMAHIKSYTAPVEIEHYSQVESASVSYNLADGITQADGMKYIDQAMFAAKLPDGITRRYTGDNQKLAEARENALIMFASVILVMYIVLGILYESLIHPLTILSTLPAAGMGAFLTMLITHTQLTTVSVIAVLMLIGIVKKNAILMVDFALVAEREGGRTPLEAIREAALVRFRPITMTTLVAMGAALPLAIGFGTGSEMRQPLGVAILGGLFVSQLLTLLSTPAIYLWQHDRRERKATRRAKRAAKLKLGALKQSSATTN